MEIDEALKNSFYINRTIILIEKLQDDVSIFYYVWFPVYFFFFVSFYTVNSNYKRHHALFSTEDNIAASDIKLEAEKS